MSLGSKRLKGAIDSRIAEEQARQRSALTSPPPSKSIGRSSSRAESPAKRAIRSGAREKRDGDPTGKGPDPSEFEPEFIIADSDPPSRVGTPRPALTIPGSPSKESSQDVLPEAKAGEEEQTRTADNDLRSTPVELPTDVRVKLRKLEKLESRYHGLVPGPQISKSC